MHANRLMQNVYRKKLLAFTIHLTQLSVSSVWNASATALRIAADRQAATMPSGLTAESDSALMSKTAPGAHHPETTTSEP